jgi:phage-related protein
VFNIQIYKNESGKDEIEEYLEELAGKAGKSKNERIKLKKIVQYFDLLGAYGLSIGEPVIKHIESDIWELRPTNDRFFYALVENDTFLILHHFIKKSRKTPRKEIEKAKNNLKDWKRRS